MKSTSKMAKKGGSRTPMSVMGSQGKSVSIKPMHNMSKSTGHSTFPASKSKRG